MSDKEKKASLCELVIRQTDYDSETAIAKLNEFDMDVEAVIRDYLGPAPRTRSPRKSLNQRIYKEIRSFMNCADHAGVNNNGNKDGAKGEDTK